MERQILPGALLALQTLPSPAGVPDACYQRVFEQDGDGARIFEELAVVFGGDTSFVPGDPHATSYNEGARTVLLYIQKRIDRCAQTTKEG